MKTTAFKNCRVVRSSWLQEGGRRLDCNPYMSGALEAREALRRLPAIKERLGDLTTGIFHAGREGRLWVDELKYGVPFMGSSDIQNSDFGHLPYLSKKQINRNPNFTLRKNWTLITRSGTIGRMAYVRPDMDGMACSEHVLRVAPNANRIEPGYLFAFLSGRYGVPLVVSGTYGAIIQHIEPEHIVDLPVPRFDASIERAIATLVDGAAIARAESSHLLKVAETRLFKALGLSQPTPVSKLPTPDVSIISSERFTDRADAYYYSARNKESRTAFDGACSNMPLGNVAEVFIPGIFKRLYATDPQYGSPYITGSDLFDIAPVSDKFLMRRVAEEYRLLLREGMIVVQEAGQLGGLIGRSVMVGKYLDGFSCSNNMIRIVPASDEDGGYIFTLLNSEHGVRLLSREAAGSSIPHTDEKRVSRIDIPWPDKDVRMHISEPAIRARELRDKANSLESQAKQQVESQVLGS